ncbi:hypothetical protein BDF19DRAFT_438097 [Syncephalis fuscata]|nr:hypothetical protein BDF19DRAFT_438097 [Syncephalis fuscata]
MADESIYKKLIVTTTEWWQKAHNNGYSEVVAAAAAVTTTAIVYRVYGRNIRRYSTASEIPTRMLKGQRRMTGVCTAVRDGDTFRLYHTPLSPLLTRIPQTRKALQGKTLSIRLAGIDAPEAAHFGMPAQPFSDEARRWLEARLLHRTILFTPYSVDRYGRLVAGVWIRPVGCHWLPFGLPLLNWLRSDISLKMLRSGLATVYTGQDAEYGNRHDRYKLAEQLARARYRGVWSLSDKKRVLPGEHKRVYLRGGR